jgi:branched-chain amino acid transport system permease protein
MQAVVQYIFAGLAIGGIYALVALGFHIMWSAARAVNFAHGDTLMLGAVLAIMGLDAGLPFPVAVALSLLASCIFGVLVERFAVRPQRQFGHSPSSYPRRRRGSPALSTLS